MADLSCGKSCMKFILFVINFLFFVLGAAGLAIGIWALVGQNKMNVLTKIDADNSDFNVIGLLETAAIVLMVGGGAILLIGFLGCCGAIKQSQCLLCLYALFLLVILILEIAAIAIAVVFQGKVEDEMRTFLKKTINSTYEGRIDTSEEFSLGLDYAQVYFQCCGVDSYTDFYGATKWNRTTNTGATMAIPTSCCHITNEDDFYEKPSSAQLKDEDCPVTPTVTNSNKDTACWNKIYDYLKERIAIVIALAAAVMGIEVICFVFACCIISALRKKNYA